MANTLYIIFCAATMLSFSTHIVNMLSPAIIPGGISLARNLGFVIMQYTKALASTLGTLLFNKAPVAMVLILPAVYDVIFHYCLGRHFTAGRFGTDGSDSAVAVEQPVPSPVDQLALDFEFRKFVDLLETGRSNPNRPNAPPPRSRSAFFASVRDETESEEGTDNDEATPTHSQGSSAKDSGSEDGKNDKDLHNLLPVYRLCKRFLAVANGEPMDNEEISALVVDVHAISWGPPWLTSKIRNPVFIMPGVKLNPDSEFGQDLGKMHDSAKHLLGYLKPEDVPWIERVLPSVCPVRGEFDKQDSGVGGGWCSEAVGELGGYRDVLVGEVCN
jgi:hypothetical protein